MQQILAVSLVKILVLVLVIQTVRILFQDPRKSDLKLSAKFVFCISLMSAPAANAFSLPVSTMQPTLLSF